MDAREDRVGMPARNRRSRSRLELSVTPGSGPSRRHDRSRISPRDFRRRSVVRSAVASDPRRDPQPSQVGTNVESVTVGMVVGIEQQVDRLDSTGAKPVQEPDRRRTARPPRPGDAATYMVISPEMNPLKLHVS